MDSFKLLSIVGARPQFIKAAPISRAIKGYNESAERVIVDKILHTGQHYDYLMSKVFFDDLGLAEPDYNLEVGSGSHGKQTGRMLEGIEEVLIKEAPHMVLVYGDTNSTLAGALAATKLQIPVAHVEAGLRSFNRTMPEEVNRVMTDHISTVLFCPSESPVKNLCAEGITQGVHNVGDVMYDSFLYSLKVSGGTSTVLKDLGVEPKEYYLSTIHRAGNTDNITNLKSILSAFKLLDKPVVLPLHPRTAGILKNELSGFDRGLTKIINPLPYDDLIALAGSSRAILTDSGGLQKEAYFLKVPCITLRDDTEWVETVEAGWNILTGAEKDRIIKACKSLDEERPPYRELYGDGHAADKIIEVINEFADAL